MSAFLIGLAFGWFLERGGMGDAPKLADQFYLRDLTVFKLMFSALVTAMLGLFWLERAGLVDPAGIFVTATVPWAQAAGGAVFGVGFVLAGLCPGTSCVAASSGRLDGVLAMGGMFLGVLVFLEAFPWIDGFYGEGEVATLPAALGWSEGTVVLLVVLAALGGFVVSERLEARAARQAEAA